MLYEVIGRDEVENEESSWILHSINIMSTAQPMNELNCLD